MKTRFAAFVLKPTAALIVGTIAVGISVGIHFLFPDINVGYLWYGLVSLVVAVLALWVGLEIYRRTDDLQQKTHALLLSGVNSRTRRTEKIIGICEGARKEVFAVTVMPVVGILDDFTVMNDYIAALWRALQRKEVRVRLISLSFADAVENCCSRPDSVKDQDLLTQRRNDLQTAEEKFAEFRRAHSDRFCHKTLPASAFGFQLFASENCGLLYVVDPSLMKEDLGQGFATEDPRVRQVLSDGFDRMWRETAVGDCAPDFLEPGSLPQQPPAGSQGSQLAAAVEPPESPDEPLV